MLQKANLNLHVVSLQISYLIYLKKKSEQSKEAKKVRALAFRRAENIGQLHTAASEAVWRLVGRHIWEGTGKVWALCEKSQVFGMVLGKVIGFQKTSQASQAGSSLCSPGSMFPRFYVPHFPPKRLGIVIHVGLQGPGNSL